MKKILAIVLCVMLVCMMSVVVFATEAEVVEGDATLDEPPVETPPAETPPEETPPVETPGEDEKSEETPPDNENSYEPLITQKIAEYFKATFDKWLLIITSIVLTYWQERKNRASNKYMTTMNNNAVSVAKNSAAAIAQTVSSTAAAVDVVNSYKTAIEKALAEVRANDEEKRELKALLAEATVALKTSKAANIELANEVAELLVLANIPNAKKDELYARHRAAVEAMAAAEETEVKENVGEEA